MARISTGIAVALRGSTGVRPGQPIAQTTPSIGALWAARQSAESDSVAFGFNISRHDLLAMNAGVDEATRTTNSLSTANDAIGVIGGLVENIQTVLLAAADPHSAPPIDPAAEQTRIDSAISTIDAIASTTQFGGQSLLQGNFSLTGRLGAVSLPSFLSSDLGTTPISGAQVSTTTLSSLKSGGPNDLTRGNLGAAGQIVTTALSQITAAQTQITGYLSDAGTLDSTTVQLPSAAVPGDLTIADAVYTTAVQMLNEPSLGALAVANSSGQNVLALLSP